MPRYRWESEAPGADIAWLGESGSLLRLPAFHAVVLVNLRVNDSPQTDVRKQTSANRPQALTLFTELQLVLAARDLRETRSL